MQSTQVCSLSITNAAEKIAGGELSPVELVDAHLERISKTDGQLNSFITVLETKSKAAAKNAELDILSGRYLGPLHGIPIGLKDLYYTKGVRTTMGSKIMADFVPQEDAAVTEKLEAAGAIIIGKLQMHEFALGATSHNPHYGPSHNPWDTDRITGGSSGGAGSSVSAGQCMGAMGTDTGGSVRIPASLCGIVGLKPTFGRVSKYATFPLSWTLDTPGPLTRTVRDAALMLNAISGYDHRDATSRWKPTEDFTAALGRNVSEIRIGIPREFFFDNLDIQVEELVSQATFILEGLVGSIDEVSLPLARQSQSIQSIIMSAEGASTHLNLLRQRSKDLDPEVRARLETGAMTPAIHYIKAQRARAAFNEQVLQVLEQVDVLLTPTTSIAAPKIEDSTVLINGKSEPAMLLLSKMTRPFNLCGLPTISLPCGFTSEGLPIGLQLVGRPFDEMTILKLAYAFEQATDWHTLKPPI